MTMTTMTGTFVQREVITPHGAFILHESAGPVGAAPVLLLHDQMATTPGAFAEAVAAEHRVLAPVLPGFGGADRPTWVASVRDVADHLLFLLDELALDGPVHLVGTSMGAWIAADLALRLQGDCRSLTMLSPVGIRVKGHPAADFWYLRQRDAILFNDPAAMPEVSAEEMVANEESSARYGWTPRLYDPTLTARLGRLAVPTLIVWSAEDRVLPVEHRDAWRSVLPAAKTAEVPGGHFACHEHPGAAAAAVLGFTGAHRTP
jgi:pimeloyl-ACP methyl ester carboxylesterase